jgi:hypothetical protein
MKKLFLFTVLLFLVSCTKGNDLKSKFPKLNFDNNLKNQPVVTDKEFLERATFGMKIKFEAENKGNLLIAEIMNDIDSEKAEKIFNYKTMMIRGLYSIQATPYSGTITRETSCTEGLDINLFPVDNKIQTSQMFNLKATERFVLGVCLEEQNVFRNQTLLLYCKNQKVFYDLRYYYLKSQKPILKPIASCVD